MLELFSTHLAALFQHHHAHANLYGSSRFMVLRYAYGTSVTLGTGVAVCLLQRAIARSARRYGVVQ